MITYVSSQMIDCFVTTDERVKSVPERAYFEDLTIKSLHLNGFYPTLIRKPLLERYYEAERIAQTDIYLLCDNDCIPATHDTLRKLVKILDKHKEYSQLGLGWLPNMEPERNSTWKTGESEEIWDFDHVGGIVAIRKGTIKDLGYKAEFVSGYGDDRVMGKTARQLGYKVGVVPSLYFYHLGSKFSIINNM